jgi:hypothetical protein
MKELLLAICLWLSVGCSPTGQAPPTFSITTSNPDDAVTFTYADGTAYFDVAAPRGIGKAQIERTAGDMPERIVFRLALKGLENFVLTFGQERVEISIPTTGAPTPIAASRRGASTEDVPLFPDNPLWMPVRIIASGQTIPLSDGHFEIQAPRALLESDTRLFGIEWIDFYR